MSYFPAPPPIGTPGYSKKDLISSILSSTSNRNLQEALLVGGMGESNLNPLSTSPGYSTNPIMGVSGGGPFGFTPPFSKVVFNPKSSVAEELPQYKAALTGTGGAGATEFQATGKYGVPTNLTGAAKAEFIAIAAERPEYDTSELKQIAATNKTTTYGANTSYTVQNWANIVKTTAPKPVISKPVTDVAYSKPIGPGLTKPVTDVAYSKPIGPGLTKVAPASKQKK